MRDLVALAVVLLPLLLFDGWDHGPRRLPDVLPPGNQPVRHELVLDWPPAKAWRFVDVDVVVEQPSRGHAIVRGEPFAFSSKYGTRIYALPPNAAAPAPDAGSTVGELNWPSCAVPVREIAFVGVGSPLARVVTTLRVVAVEGSEIRLEPVREQRFAQDGSELGDLDWVPLAVLAGCGVLWLALLDRRNARAEADR